MVAPQRSQSPRPYASRPVILNPPVTSTFDARIAARLAALDLTQRRRAPRRIVRLTGPRVRIGATELLSFASNDYLGLRDDPRVVAAFKRAADRYGVGAAAAHLLGGHHPEHAELERELADWLRRPAALLFSSGWQAALGTLPALLKRDDAVFQDRWNHASLLDASLLARIRAQRYPHLDLGALDRLLTAAAERPEQGRLIVSDAVFSMDGDVAPVAGLAALAARHSAWLMLDEAHALGVLGPEGAGAAAEAGLDVDAVPILLGTLGKALGTFGACIAGSAALCDFLVNQARSWIYTTALPPAVAAATREALRIARLEAHRREHLQALGQRLQQGLAQLGLNAPAVRTPIQPLILGHSSAALAASAALETAGLHVPAIRPPTVPEGTARLRISLSAAHSEADVDHLLAALDDLKRQPPRTPPAPRLAIERHGQRGPQLLLLHGWGLHGGIFAPLVAQLATDHRIAVVDLPGHGHSRESPLPLDPAAIAAELLPLFPGAHWFGWSLGGLISLVAAQAATPAVRSLCLCAASPCFVERPHWPAGMPLPVFESFAGDLARDWAGTLDRFLVLETLGAEQPLVELKQLRQLAVARGAPQAEALAAGLAVLGRSDLVAQLPTLRPPPLWLGGLRDRVVSPAALRAAAMATPGARVELLERCGHAPFLTRPDLVAALWRQHVAAAEAR